MGVAVGVTTGVAVGVAMALTSTLLHFVTLVRGFLCARYLGWVLEV